ncbi:hypothetical protein ACJ41O_000960 [Fusarium nematophilum]
MISKGSSFHRHYNTETSARQIFEALASHDAPFATDLQRQLVDENRTLYQTFAGRELQSELLKERERASKQLREVEEQMRETIRDRDLETEEMKREQRDIYTRMIKKVEANTDALQSSMQNLIAHHEERVALLKKKMEEKMEELRQANDRPPQPEEENPKPENRSDEKRQDERQPDDPKGRYFSPYSIFIHGSHYTQSSPSHRSS